jgi:tRNA(fMet)-specific endonuclease VapC
MIYLLDSNACIQLLNHRQSPVEQHLAQHTPAHIALCNVVKGELLYGAYRSQRVEANLHLLHAFFAPFASLPLNDAAAEHYGQIRADLMAKGTPIGPNDLLIAAIARAHDAILITHNTGEFGRVAGLRIEDWEVA